MTKSLITGASGFIGGHLAEALLARGRDVRCLVRRTSVVEQLPAGKVELVYGDLRDESAIAEAVAGVDEVYHLAAMTSAHRLADMLEANARGSERIAAACAARRTPPTLVAVSSIAASGPIQRGRIRTEADPPSPVSNYGRSKLAGEQTCRAFADRLPITIVRAAIVFGPRNRDMLPMFTTIRRLRCHPVPTLNPPPLSYIHVSELVEQLIRSAESGKRLTVAAEALESPGAGVYFASVDEHPTYAEFGLMVRPMLNRPFAPAIYLPGFMAYPLAGLNQSVMRLRGKSDTFNIDKIREATASSWACSGEAARHDLQLASPPPLAERLAETIRWYREARWL